MDEVYGRRRNVYRRSDTLRCFLLKVETVYGHSSGESLKWAPKVHGQEVLISQAKGQSDNDVKREGSLSFLRQSISVSKCSGFFIYLELRDDFI